MIKLHLKKLLCEIIDKYNLCVVNVQRINERKQLYNNEIRSLISKRKKFERCDSSGKNYEKKLIKPDAKTDRKSARYNSDTVKKSIRKKCSDPTRLIREVFTRSGKCMILSIIGMMHLIKQHQVLPLEWSNIWSRTLKKSKGSIKILNNYRGIFIINIMSIIF